MSAPPPALKLGPLDTSAGLRRLATDAIRRAIMDMDLYGHQSEIRLDERQLSQELGVSRTPIREALGFLEQEGLVRSIPRRGVFVVRKSKAEILEMILVWAAIESLAARLATQRASDAEFGELRHLFDAFDADPSAHLHEYSQANMAFHKAIIRLGGCRADERAHRHAVPAHARRARRHHGLGRPRPAQHGRTTSTSSTPSSAAMPTGPNAWCASTRSALPSISKRMAACSTPTRLTFQD